MIAELSRAIGLSKIRPAGQTIQVRATLEECVGVAARMGVPAVRSLECIYNLAIAPDGVSIWAKGHLRAQVTRECVVSAQDFETAVEDFFMVCFVPAGLERCDSNPDLPDEIPYEGDTIDLGEATVEQFLLVLDPYPRIEGSTIMSLEDATANSSLSILPRRAEVDTTGE